jgi:hypothetical protein
MPGIHSVLDFILSLLSTLIVAAFFIINAFVDDFPLSLVTFPIMGGTIGSALILIVTRLMLILNGIGRLAQWQSTPLRRQLEELWSFARFCVLFVPLTFLAGTVFVFTFGLYLQLAAAEPDQLEQLRIRSFWQTFSDLWTWTAWGCNCSAWHSWKGVPEGNLAWLEWLGLIDGQFSKAFGYNCNEWFRRYSVAINFLVSPVIIMTFWAAWKVAYLNARRLLGFPSPPDYGPGWGDKLASSLGLTTAKDIVEEIGNPSS